MELHPNAVNIGKMIVTVGAILGIVAFGQYNHDSKHNEGSIQLASMAISGCDAIKPYQTAPGADNSQLINLASQIYSNKSYLCDSTEGMREIVGNPTTCSGWAGNREYVADRRKQFVADFHDVTKDMSPDVQALCPVLTAMADMESGFSEKARSWDTFCPTAQDQVTSCVDTQLCNPPSQSWLPYGVCYGGYCRPVQGGFGQLQFDLMWFNATGLRMFSTIPVTAKDQLSALFTNDTHKGKAILDFDGNPVNMLNGSATSFGSLFQSCQNTRADSSHFSSTQWEAAVTECTAQMTTGASHADMCAQAQAHCPYTAHGSSGGDPYAGAACHPPVDHN